MPIVHAGKAAIENIRRRASACGYDPAYAPGRLRYGTFVSLARRYVYVETPKAACTSIKRMIAALDGVDINYTSPPYHRETRLEMFVHQRRYFDLPSLLDLDQTVRDDIFSGADRWFAFATSRNPFSRAVSVFENKIRLGEPRYRALEARYGDRGAFSSVRDAFKAFVDEVLCDPARRDLDPHFSAQSRLLMPRLIPYSRIFKLDEMDQLVEQLTAHVGVEGGADAPALPRENAGFGGSWRDYYDGEAALGVAQAYAEDFSVFGYDPQDWRGGSGSVEDPDWMRRWRAEIVERNATIDRLYDWLDAAKQG